MNPLRGRARWMAVSFAIALSARVIVAYWASSRFPPAADGTYYDILARRIADGHGYTWAWPDGAVTYVAHYPVGYPAFIAAVYTLFGRNLLPLMLVQALVGALAAPASVVLVSPLRKCSVMAATGLLVALQPALVGYTPAWMTEGLTASWVVIAFACVQFARESRSSLWLLCACLVLTAGIFVRPQCLVFAPFLGIFAASTQRTASRVRQHWMGLVCGLATFVVCLGLCLPWTLRNCDKMKSCALISVNGGWNLLIGVQTASGAWEPIAVPDPCKNVFDEAGKDACFGRVAKQEIRQHPLAWLSKMPRKLTMTFEYLGAAPYYLHASNPNLFDQQAKERLGILETAFCRVALALALGAAFQRISRRKGLWLLGGLGLVPMLAPVAYGLLAVLSGILGLRRPSHVFDAATCAVIGSTWLLHGIFFGAGRYALVATPWVCMAAAAGLAHRNRTSPSA